MNTLKKNQEICSVCEDEPEDILILSCRHNLCLDCATQVFSLSSKQDRITCEICMTDTSLDQDTIVCLRSLSAKNIQQASTVISNNTQLDNKNYPPIPRNHNSHYVVKQQLPSIQQEKFFLRCDKHQQPLTYYCMDCNCFKICSECMLLENHRFHKVVTLRKASLQIKETIQKVGRQKLKLKNLLQKDRQSLILRREESEKQLQINVRELKAVFDQATKMFLLKYEQLKKKMEDEAARKLEIMQGAINQIQQKIQLIDETVLFEEELIRSALKSEGSIGSNFQMFEYYESQMSQNKVDFQPQLPNFISEVSSQKFSNATAFFNNLSQLLQQISTLNLTDQQVSQENINYISQIENQNYQPAQTNLARKNKNNDQENNQQNTPFPDRKIVSQNINIIQLNSMKRDPQEKKNSNQYSKNTIQTLDRPKQSKQIIDAIKKKARQNLRDKDLSQSRKMELSRSIQNATDILNKIQERSCRI